jgi:DNA-binding beta-propeller fold protein YncE
LHVAEVSEVALHSVALSNTIFAGSGDFAFADGVGTQASFRSPQGVSISPDGTFALVADVNNHRIRRVSIATGSVTTLAGSVAGHADGVGTQASFKYPQGVSISPDGMFALVAETGNALIRHVSIATGSVTTLAGSGNSTFADGVGTQASFDYPQGVSISPDGTYALVADSNNRRIRRVSIATGSVTTLVGSVQGFADGVGSQASFGFPEGVSISPDGTYALVADLSNHRIRRVSIATGNVTTLAGSVYGFADGVGTQVRFGFPEGVSISPDGTYALVADGDNTRIRRVSIPTGSVTTLFGIDVAAVGGISFSPASSLVLLTYPAANTLVRLSLFNACPAGSFCPQGSSIPTSCAVGSYCPLTGLSAASAQSTCPSAGYVCTTAGLAVPLACQPGYFCAPGSFNVYGAIDNQGVCLCVSVCVTVCI